MKELFSSIVIPGAVYFEVAGDLKKRNGSQLVSTSDWILRQDITNQLTVDVLAASVDMGEAEANTLAKELQADLLLIDDKAGRKIARSVDIPVTGTIGILLRYYKGKQDEFKLALDELVAHGFRFSQKEYDRVLELAKNS